MADFRKEYVFILPSGRQVQITNPDQRDIEWLVRQLRGDDEREACARVCEEIGQRRDRYGRLVGTDTAYSCAGAIRSRRR